MNNFSPQVLRGLHELSAYKTKDHPMRVVCTQGKETVRRSLPLAAQLWPELWPWRPLSCASDRHSAVFVSQLYCIACS